jgi:hypothetical protein
MKFAQRLLLLAGALFACQFSVGLERTAAAPADNEPASTADATVSSQSVRTKNTMLIRDSSGGVSSGTSSTKTITIEMPVETRPETIRVILNGKDVTPKFAETACSEAVCETSTLSSADGLQPGKNVLYAIAKKSDGTLASSRLHFNGKTAPVTKPASRSQVATKVSANLSTTARPAAVVGSSPIGDGYLPPAVIFNTLTPGGWNGKTPWIQIGYEQLPTLGGSICSGSFNGYLAVVVNRQTLLEVPGATQCFPGSQNLAAYLQTLTNDRIAIVGTIQGFSAAGDLDTSAIGGTNYTSLDATGDYPQSYMTIGAGGAAAGSAYENFYTNNMAKTLDASATGALIEDTTGNYNFQPSDTFEYQVTPNDPNNGSSQSTVTLFNIGSLFRYNQFSYPGKVVFYSPANQTNGFWLMKLQRNNLDNLDFDTNCGAAANSAKQQTDVNDCGTFYSTGASEVGTQVLALSQLAHDLNVLNADQLAFLVSVGTPFNATSTRDLAGRAYQGVAAYGHNFADALEKLGGVPISTLSLYVPGSNYTLVSCTDCGNALNGHVVLSTTAYAQQGQTGSLHGILQRNLHGLFWPTRASQESSGSDYTLDIVNSQQPVEWPELTGNLLPGASTLAGQYAAYQYASYQLLTQYYIKGAQGAYLDNIHYYFTGSLNTLLDYHTFDPVNLPFPGAANSCYVWTDPVTKETPECFTAQDLQAVAQQLSTEIIDLDNVLHFMVTGPTNMKDVVASGNGSAALALIGAAASIEGSNLQPPQSTPVTANIDNILNLVGSTVGVTAALASGNPELAPVIAASISGISSIFEGAGDVAGGLSTGGGPAPLPGPERKLVTTIGDLANGSLQQQISIGFDTELDTILGDWGKLSQIGPLVTDTNKPAFYAPNQVAQNLAIQAMGQASQRAFYMALLPTSYKIHYWQGWFGYPALPVNPPDMGMYDGNGVCRSIYPWYGSNGEPLIDVPAYVDRAVPTYAGVDLVLWNEDLPSFVPIDHYLIVGAVQNPGKIGGNSENFPFLDSQVANTMFSASGLNIPLDEFVTSNGPMATASAFENIVQNPAPVYFNVPGVTGCYYGNHNPPGGVGLPVPGSGPTPNPTTATTTTLVGPTSSVLGESVTLQAKVTASSGPVPSGTVTFDDGKIQIGTATLDGRGEATFSTSTLALGTHSIAAYYVANGKLAPSQSGVSTLTVYANSPDMTLSLSANSVNLAYGATSSPVSLQVASRSGLTGTVTLSCAGLPVGVTCVFNPAQPTITAGGQATSSLTISAVAVRSAGMSLPKGTGAFFLAPVYLFLLWRVRKDARKLRMLVCALLLSVVSLGCLTACSGGSKTTQPTPGSQTILVIATSGSTTKSTPVIVNFQ